MNGHPFVFNFAVRNHINNKPKIEPIPDFVLSLNQLFTFNVSVIDYSEDENVWEDRGWGAIQETGFSSSNPLIEIDYSTGELFFVPEEVGDFETIICFEDDINQKDCETVKFKVENE